MTITRSLTYYKVHAFVNISRERLFETYKNNHVMNKYRHKVSFKILLVVEYTQLRKVEFVVDTDLEK